MSHGEVLAGSNGEDERGCKGKKGGRRAVVIVRLLHRNTLRVKGTAYGEESLVSESKNGFFDGCISIELCVGGVEVSVIDKFSC